VPESQETYDPDKSLADSLGELSMSIEEMPPIFKGMTTDIDKAAGDLDLIKTNLDTMSQSVGLISISLIEYKAMIANSQAGMDNLETLLTNLQSDLGSIINISTIILWLFFLWMLAAQVVVFSQGWELYHGTAGQMSGGKGETTVAKTENTD